MQMLNTDIDLETHGTELSLGVFTSVPACSDCLQFQSFGVLTPDALIWGLCDLTVLDKDRGRTPQLCPS